MGSCLSFTTQADSSVPPAPNPYEQSTYENTPEYTLEGLRTTVKVLRILDGDTVDIALYHPAAATVFRHRVRLYGIDTPEKRPPKDQPNREAEIAASARSTAALRQRLEAIGNMPFAVFHKADKYGRLMCTFYPSDQQRENINEWMVTEGFAYAYFGKTKKKFGELEQEDRSPGEPSPKRNKKQARVQDQEEKEDSEDQEDQDE